MPAVRRAREKDIPHILELYRQLSLEPDRYQAAPLDDCLKVFREMYKYTGHTLLVADDNGRVIGTALLAIIPGFTHATRPFAMVEYVVVDEKYRSNGIGKMLMDSVISLSKEASCYKIMLISDLRREHAHKFYESLDFEASAYGFRLYL